MKKIQQQKQLTAHDKILLFDNLRYLLEGLEEYIEKAEYYPDFKNRRKLQNITIPRERSDNLTADSAEQFFKTNLILYVSMVEEAPPSEREKLVEEYLKWINVVGIDPNNCPEKLRQFLIEIKNVLEGNSDRIFQQTKEYLDNKDKENPFPSNPQDTLALFSAIQKPLNKNREQAKLYEGQVYSDVEIANKFGGNVEQGQEVFSRIASSTTSGSGDFHFYPQQGQQQSTSLTDDENSDIIRNVRNNRNNWRIETIQGQVWLIHSSAQGTDSEVGTLIHNQQRFTDNEWRQIQQAISASQQQAQQQQQSYRWSWDKK